ncbi:restriction endonuclease subunit S [Dorea sp. YH-dor228]|uniref:restriction endonuclease subunit S n=1 Tax=Dorea sp. YH-dor228 TaxID=3151120 RepID=UPI0032422685
MKCIEDEIPFDVPEGWAWSRLHSLTIKIGAGSTPTGGATVYTTSGIKFIRSQNVYDDGLILNGVAYISEEINQKKSGSIVKPKDILLNITGGSIGRCALVPDDFDIANVNQHVIIIRLANLELRKYIHSVITSTYIQEQILSRQVGSGRGGLSAETLSTFLIPLPPLNEQVAIEGKLNDCISRVLTITDSQSNISDLISMAKSKILDLAIRGQLIPQNSDDEPASALLDRIRTEKEELIKQGKIKRNKKESVIFKGEDNSYYEKIGDKVYEYTAEDLPLGWSIASFSQANMFSTETIDPSHFPAEMFELYSVPNFELGVPEIIKGREIGSSKQSICENDVLVCKINPRINRVWIAGHITSYRILGSSEWVVFRNDYLYAPYMQFYFSAPYFRELLLSNVSGVGGSLMRAQPESVKKYPILVPPYKEQVRIAEKISELFIKLDDIEKSLS